MNWKKLISQSVGQEQLAPISNFVLEEASDQRSSIDRFYDESRRILSATPATLDPNDWIGPAYAVALVSLTENYFRSVLGDILKICYVTKKNAAESSINFGSVLWHPGDFIERGVFEHISFSDSNKIIDVTRKVVGEDLRKTDLIPILDEFSKVCELRHGIVHSGRYMAGKNALILDFPSSKKLIKITVGYGQLQSIASVCTTLVVSYNQKMFELLCHRWATSWRQMTIWKPELENSLIKRIWNIFYSKVDQQDGTIEENGTWVKCRNLLKDEYNL